MLSRSQSFLLIHQEAEEHWQQSTLPYIMNLAGYFDRTGNLDNDMTGEIYRLI